MAIKTISYTVSALGIEPRTKQFCGVQGDHNIYRLDFNLESDLWNGLLEQAKDKGTLYYHFDLYNGEGGTASTKIKTLENQLVSLDVGEWLTRFGGVGKAVFVITLSEDSITHLELYSFPALLQFKNRPTGSEANEKGHQSMTTLAMMAKKAADNAEAARLQAQEASDSAKDVKTAMSKGMVLKLEGKRAGGIADIFATISASVEETGKNPVSGEAVSKALKDLGGEIQNQIETIKADTLSEAHPVGSLYWSKFDTDPTTLFGGTWERIKGAFIYAATDKDEIGGDVKGNANGEVTLEANNIAEHYHKGIYFNDVALVGLTGTTAQSDGIVLKSDATLKTYAKPLKIGANDLTDNKVTPINIMPPYKAYYCWIRTE